MLRPSRIDIITEGQTEFLNIRNKDDEIKALIRGNEVDGVITNKRIIKEDIVIEGISSNDKHRNLQSFAAFRIRDLQFENYNVYVSKRITIDNVTKDVFECVAEVRGQVITELLDVSRLNRKIVGIKIVDSK